jgi:hypothetical protein
VWTISPRARCRFFRPVIFKELTKKQVKTISPEEAAARVESGEWVLVDVRLKEQHDEATPEGAVSVPIYEVGRGGSIE